MRYIFIIFSIDHVRKCIFGCCTPTDSILHLFFWILYTLYLSIYFANIQDLRVLMNAKAKSPWPSLTFNYHLPQSALAYSQPGLQSAAWRPLSRQNASFCRLARRPASSQSVNSCEKALVCLRNSDKKGLWGNKIEWRHWASGLQWRAGPYEDF